MAAKDTLGFEKIQGNILLFATFLLALNNTRKSQLMSLHTIHTANILKNNEY